MEFYDNTKVSTYKACPRKYLYRHVLHLRPEGISPALSFGLAWSTAMDEAWRLMAFEGITDPVKVTQGAYVKGFEPTWAEQGMPSISEWGEDEEGIYAPRTPFTALGMLEYYTSAVLPNLLSKCELVAIEQPFAVPLEPGDTSTWYCGRQDKVILRDDGMYAVLDHKTTTAYKRDGYFRSTWMDSFCPNSQMEGYAFEGFVRYGDRFAGVYVDGALVHKTVHVGFTLLPAIIGQDMDALDQWLWEVKDAIWQIREDTRRLEVDTHTEHTLRAFPRNTGECFTYGSPCPYIDICRSFQNPMKEIEDYGTPMGFTIEPWEPFEVNRIKELGLKEEE